jgi:ribose/xylose/arabinose/galactoside ABC-type transport system permease subunit
MADLSMAGPESDAETSAPKAAPDQPAQFVYCVGDIIRLVIMIVLALLSLIALAGFLAASNSSFVSSNNTGNILLQVGVYGLLAIGMTFVILNRSIDLSVGAMAVLAGITAATTYNSGGNVGAAVIAAIAVGLIGGFLQGLLITVLSIPSYIVTLGGAALFSSLALQLSNGKMTVIRGNDYLGIARGTPGELPALFVIFLLAAVVAQVIQIALYVVTRRVQQLGNPSAPRSTEPLKPSQKWTPIIVGAIGRIAAFTLMGALAALSGYFLTARLAAAQPIGGSDWVLISAAAVLIGGTSVSSGKGCFIGTVIGLIFVYVLLNGANMTNLSVMLQGALVATALGIAVVLNRQFELGLAWLANSVPVLKKPIF